MTQTEFSNEQRRLLDRATEKANEAARGFLLDQASNALFVDQVTDISASSLFVLKRSWKPFQQDPLAPSGMGLRFNGPDPLVLQLMQDHDLYDEAYAIAMTAFVDAIMEDPKPFLEALLNDLISDESFYAEFTSTIQETI